MKLKNLKDFIHGSTTFGSICFSGNYEIDLDVFYELLEHYMATGENLLDDYSEIIYLMWINDDDNNIIETIKHVHLDIALSKFLKKGYFIEERGELRAKIRNGYKRHIDLQNQVHVIRRRKACSFTSRKDVREYVFDKYGEKCLRCGSINNISLDHVIPVMKKGIDSVDNLQPLCTSCNSWKSGKIIDYRKEACNG